MWTRAAISFYGLVGASGMAYGLYLWWPPAAPMFAGAFVIADAWLLGARLRNDGERKATRVAR